jgi:hypothetical protein
MYENPNITWDIIQENSIFIDNNGVHTGSEALNLEWDYDILLIYKNFFNGLKLEKIRNIISHFKTNITEELMMYVWNPTRVEKWKYLLDDEEV